MQDLLDLARARTSKPWKSDDVRALRSVEAMRAAFLELIEQNPIEDISIKEITDRAGISYPTFFRRYASKNDLMESIATEEVRKLFPEEMILEGNSRILCDYVHRNRKLWSVLLNGGAAHAMRKEFMRIARENAQTQQQVNPWFPTELAVPFVTSGIFELLAWWLREPEDYPLEKVVKLFNVLIVDAAARPRDITI